MPQGHHQMHYCCRCLAPPSLHPRGPSKLTSRTTGHTFQNWQSTGPQVQCDKPLISIHLSGLFGSYSVASHEPRLVAWALFLSRFPPGFNTCEPFARPARRVSAYGKSMNMSEENLPAEISCRCQLRPSRNFQAARRAQGRSLRIRPHSNVHALQPRAVEAIAHCA